MIKHLVFDTTAVAALQAAQALEESLAGDIVALQDDYAVGPLYLPGHAEAWQQRKQWWQEVLALSADEEGAPPLPMVQDVLILKQLTDWLDADAEHKLWLWAAQNAHDVCGYYWLMSQLTAYQGRVFILYLNNLPFFNNQGGIFYPKALHEIPPREFLKARRLARAITPSEFEIDPDEWRRIATSNSILRLLEGGKKLSLHAADHFDAALQPFLAAENLKINKAVQQFLSKTKAPLSEAYVLWRIRTLLPPPVA